MRNFEEFYEKLKTELKNQSPCSDHPEHPCVETLIKHVKNDIINTESEGITVRSHISNNDDFIPKDHFRRWYERLFEEGRKASLDPSDKQNNPESDRSCIVGALIAKCFPDVIIVEDGGRAIRLNRLE
jgi:hypothetical protein